MHRMHRMEEGTEMSVDTIISGDSTKVIVRVMKRANLAEGQMEDVMIHLDGLGLPEGALSGEPHVFMFKSEAMGGPDMVWNEAAPGAGNAFFMASNKAILGVKLEKARRHSGCLRGGGHPHLHSGCAWLENRRHHRSGGRENCF